MSEKKPRKRKPVPSSPDADPDTIAAAAPTIEDLRRHNEDLKERDRSMRRTIELLERELADRVNGAAQAQAFVLIKALATHRQRFESIEVRAAPEQIRGRAVPFEATIVVTYPAGTDRHTAVASDPARALLLALAQFSDMLTFRDGADLSTLFTLIDSQWTPASSGYFRPVKLSDFDGVEKA